jgi:DNA primase
MIPIRDAGGRMVGFGARTLDPDGVPKYLNSPQTTVFDKSRLLFGLDLAKRHIREARQVVIVEGYMDVMQAWQANFQNVVAQMGTALTEQQLRLAKRFTKRFVLALDADAAGAQATLRSLEVAREVLDREQDARFNARGLVKYEGRLQADIRVVTLPEGNDPDQIIRSDPDLWLALVSGSKPVVEYVIDVAIAGLDKNDAKAKTAVAKQVLPLIGDVVDPVERDHYRQLLARRLQVDERALRKVTLTPVRRRSVSTPSGQRSTVQATGKGLTTVMRGKVADSDIRRDNFLRQCLSHPQIIGQVDERLVENKQSNVSEDDFSRPDDRVLWRQLRTHYGHWPVVTADDLWDSPDDEFLRDRVQKLLTLPDTPESELNRLPDILVMSVLDWRLERVKSLIDEVKHLYNEMQTQSDADMLALYNRQLRDLPLQYLSINKARGAMSASGRSNNSQALKRSK